MSQLRRVSLLWASFVLMIIVINAMSAVHTGASAVDDPRSLWDLSAIHSVSLDAAESSWVGGRLEVEFTSEIVEGVPLRIFGILTKPINVGPNNRAPGVLLVHGKDGTHASMTAHSDVLVREGYVTFAIDRPGRGKSGGPAEDWPNDVNVTPTPKGSYSYHSIVSMIRALQYLATRPEVDESAEGKKLLGVVGVSRGGIYVLIQSCIDPDVQAAVSIIGCGSLEEAADDGAGVAAGIRREAGTSRWPIYLRYFDPVSYAVREYQLTPVLIAIGTNDDRFGLRAINTTYNAFNREKEIVLVANVAHSSRPLEMTSSMVVWLDRNLRKRGEVLKISSVSWAYDSSKDRWRFEVKTNLSVNPSDVEFYYRSLGDDWSKIRYSNLQWGVAKLNQDSSGNWEASMALPNAFLWFICVRGRGAPYPAVATTQIFLADSSTKPNGSTLAQTQTQMKTSVSDGKTATESRTTFASTSSSPSPGNLNTALAQDELLVISTVVALAIGSGVIAYLTRRKKRNGSHHSQNGVSSTDEMNYLLKRLQYTWQAEPS